MSYCGYSFCVPVEDQAIIFVRIFWVPIVKQLMDFEVYLFIV